MLYLQSFYNSLDVAILLGQSQTFIDVAMRCHTVTLAKKMLSSLPSAFGRAEQFLILESSTTSKFKKISQKIEIFF